MSSELERINSSLRCIMILLAIIAITFIAYAVVNP